MALPVAWQQHTVLLEVNNQVGGRSKAKYAPVMRRRRLPRGWRRVRPFHCGQWVPALRPPLVPQPLVVILDEKVGQLALHVAVARGWHPAGADNGQGANEHLLKQ